MDHAVTPIEPTCDGALRTGGTWCSPDWYAAIGIAVAPRFDRVRMLLLAFVATVPLLAFDPWADFDAYFGLKATILHVTAFALATWWLFAFATGAARIERVSPLLAVGLLLVGWLVASTLMSVDPPRAIWGSPGREDGLLLWFVNLLVFATAVSVSSRRAWRFVLVASALASIAVSLYAIAQHFGLDTGTLPAARTYARSSATLRNPVFLGGYLTLVLPLVVSLAVVAVGRVRLTLWSLGAGCVLAAVYFTFSRAAWGGALLGTIVLVAIAWRCRVGDPRRVVAVLCVAGALALALAAAPRPAHPGVQEQSLVATAASAVDVDGARNAGRLAIWAIALKMIEDRPWFGTGPDQMGSVFDEYRTERFDQAEGVAVVADRAHSEPLHLAVTVGIPGALLCYAFLGTALWRAGGRVRRRGPMELPWVALGCGVGAYMLASLVSITVPGVHTLFFLFLGGLAQTRQRR